MHHKPRQACKRIQKSHKVHDRTYKEIYACFVYCFLETRKVPEIWKCANIVPIYKKGNKDEVNI